MNRDRDPPPSRPDFALAVHSPTRRHYPSGSHKPGWRARCLGATTAPGCKERDSPSLGKAHQVTSVQFSTSTPAVPQCLPNLFLINAQRVPDRPETHPQPPHGIRLGADSLVLKRILGKHHKLQFDPRDGSNWSQPCPRRNAQVFDPLDAETRAALRDTLPRSIRGRACSGNARAFSEFFR